MKYDFSHWGGRLPTVSCQCITYGRLELLEEAIQSFLLQDYPGWKELVILNDVPGVQLSMKFPREKEEIRIYNEEVRYATIGEKRNACVDLCQGEIICPWDDDDISLPWRISTIVQEMKNYQYYKPGRFWFISSGVLHPVPKKNVAHAMGGWSKSLWKEMGMYPKIQSGQDVEFEHSVRAYKMKDCHSIPIESLFYIYRWGTGHYHLSGYGRGQSGFTKIGKRIEVSVDKGEHPLFAGWKRDYVKLTKKAILAMTKEEITNAEG